jgi:hypothetical protein
MGVYFNNFHKDVSKETKPRTTGAAKRDRNETDPVEVVFLEGNVEEFQPEGENSGL